MDNETRQFGRRGDDASDTSTRYLSPSQSSSQGSGHTSGQSVPHQYMPGEGDSRYAPQSNYPETQFGGYGTGGYEPYEEPYRPEPAQSGKSGGGAGSIIMALLALLLGIAAIAMFFLWRGAESRANKPEPAPVTITQTETVTTTPSSLLDDLFKRDRGDDSNGGDGVDEIQPEPGQQAPQLPENLPTELPDDIPEEYRQGAEDILNQLDGLLNG